MNSNPIKPPSPQKKERGHIVLKFFTRVVLIVTFLVPAYVRKITIFLGLSLFGFNAHSATSFECLKFLVKENAIEQITMTELNQRWQEDTLCYLCNPVDSRTHFTRWKLELIAAMEDALDFFRLFPSHRLPITAKKYFALFKNTFKKLSATERGRDFINKMMTVNNLPIELLPAEFYQQHIGLAAYTHPELRLHLRINEYLENGMGGEEIITLNSFLLASLGIKQPLKISLKEITDSLLLALSELPDQNIVVLRSTRLSFNTFNSLQVGGVYTTPRLVSSTRDAIDLYHYSKIEISRWVGDLPISNDYSDAEYYDIPVQMIILGKTAKSIESTLEATHGEKEFLFVPNTRFVIEEIIRNDSGPAMIFLSEL